MVNKHFYHVSDVDVIKDVPLLETCNAFLKHLESYKCYPALKRFEETLTYGELLENIGKRRGFYRSLDIKKGTHIGMVLNNDFSFIETYLAVVSLGMVAVLIPVQGMPFIDNFVKQNDIDILIIDNALEKPILQIPMYTVSETEGYSYHDVESVDPSDPATIMFTGGTTGKQKGVVLSHKNIMIGTYNGIFGATPLFDQTYFTLIPFTHSFGLIRSVLTPLLTRSSVAVVYEMKYLFRDLTVLKPTAMVLVPALANMFINVVLSKGSEAIGGSLIYVICGGATVTPKIIDKYRKAGIKIFAGYGLTETSLLVSGNPNTFENPKSVGFFYDGQSYKVVNGELYLKGSNVMLGYYKNDRANKEAFDSEGFFKTGDLVTIDEEGYIYIVGRNNNIILFSNGESVSPEAIEDLYNENPLVEDCLCFASKDKNNQDVIAVEIYPSYPTITKLGLNEEEMYEKIKDVVATINKKLPLFMRVKKFELRHEDFKRNAAQKIIRNR